MADLTITRGTKPRRSKVITQTGRLANGEYAGFAVIVMKDRRRYKRELRRWREGKLPRHGE